MSGVAKADLAGRALEAGSVAQVTKPLDENQLAGAVRQALRADATRRSDPGAELDHHHLMVMIESMLREGRSEREITRALGRAAAPAELSSRPFVASGLRALLRRLGGRPRN